MNHTQRSKNVNESYETIKKYLNIDSIYFDDAILNKNIPESKLIELFYIISDKEKIKLILSNPSFKNSTKLELLYSNLMPVKSVQLVESIEYFSMFFEELSSRTPKSISKNVYSNPNLPKSIIRNNEIDKLELSKNPNLTFDEFNERIKDGTYLKFFLRFNSSADEIIKVLQHFDITTDINNINIPSLVCYNKNLDNDNMLKLIKFLNEYSNNTIAYMPYGQDVDSNAFISEFIIKELEELEIYDGIIKTQNFDHLVYKGNIPEVYLIKNIEDILMNDKKFQFSMDSSEILKYTKSELFINQCLDLLETDFKSQVNPKEIYKYILRNKKAISEENIRRIVSKNIFNTKELAVLAENDNFPSDIIHNIVVDMNKENIVNEKIIINLIENLNTKAETLNLLIDMIYPNFHKIVESLIGNPNLDKEIIQRIIKGAYTNELLDLLESPNFTFDQETQGMIFDKLENVKINRRVSLFKTLEECNPDMKRKILQDKNDDVVCEYILFKSVNSPKELVLDNIEKKKVNEIMNINQEDMSDYKNYKINNFLSSFIINDPALKFKNVLLNPQINHYEISFETFDEILLYNLRNPSTTIEVLDSISNIMSSKDLKSFIKSNKEYIAISIEDKLILSNLVSLFNGKDFSFETNKEGIELYLNDFTNFDENLITLLNKIDITNDENKKFIYHILETNIDNKEMVDKIVDYVDIDDTPAKLAESLNSKYPEVFINKIEFNMDF